MKINTSQLALTNTILLTVILSILMAFVAGVYLYISGLASARPPAQAAIITLDPKPPQKPLCPGDTIRYTFGAQPLRTPIVIRIITTLWSVDKAETMVGQRLGAEEVRVWTSLDLRVNEESYIIPTHDDKGRPLAAGRYQLRQALVAESSAPSAFSLSFAIDEECKL